MLVVVVVCFCWICTEAKPCSLGRSGSAYPNERRCDSPVAKPRLHTLVALLPRVIFFRFSHDNHSCRWRQGWSWFPYRLGYFCKLHPLPSVVQRHRSVFPLAHQRLAFGGTLSAI